MRVLTLVRLHLLTVGWETPCATANAFCVPVHACACAIKASRSSGVKVRGSFRRISTLGTTKSVGERVYARVSAVAHAASSISPAWISTSLRRIPASPSSMMSGFPVRFDHSRATLLP